MVRDHDLSERELSGAEFWSMLSTPIRTELIGLRWQLQDDVTLYPFTLRPGASRFNPIVGIPPLIEVTLPHLTQRPDDLYAELERRAPEQPQRLLSEHFLWLFGQLAGDRRPSVVVERSGGSLAYASSLLQLFPGARVIHLFRDGRECAVSMSRHWRYKMAAIRAALHARIGYDPYRSVGPAWEDPVLSASSSAAADGEMSGLMPDRITRASYEKFEVPLSRYGAMWSQMVTKGVTLLPDRFRLLELDYGDLVAHPEESIGSLLSFLELEPDPDWQSRIGGGIREGRDVRTEAGQAQWEELTRVCSLGMNRLYGRGNWA